MAVVKFLIIFTLISFAAAQFYMMDIVHFDWTIDRTRCSGALFNNTAMIFPASCLNNIPDGDAWIRQTNVFPSGMIGTSTRPPRDIEIHPNYDNNPDNYNLAVAINWGVDNGFAPRRLRYIPHSQTNCYLHGLMFRNGRNEDYYDDPIFILPPEECDFDNPHTFCTVFDSFNHPTCGFRFGSPVTCDGSTVAGLLLNENFCEARNITQNGVTREVPMLRFISMSAANEWLQQ